MSVFDRLRSSRKGIPATIALYGPPGVGKTRLACEFPDPIYLYVDGEEPPDDIEMGASDEITSFESLLDTFSDLLTIEHDRKTVIIDSLDKVEPMVWASTCARNGWDNIDSNDKGAPTAFGKGYLAADVEWRDYFAALSALNNAGMYVVQILHSQTKTFKDPLVDDYDRYRPKLQSRALDLVVENSKALLFISRRTTVKQIKSGFTKETTSKPEGMSGSERVIHTDERAGFLAKNRLDGIPASIPFKKGQGFSELSKYFSMPAVNDNYESHQEAA